MRLIKGFIGFGIIVLLVFTVERFSVSLAKNLLFLESNYLNLGADESRDFVSFDLSGTTAACLRESANPGRLCLANALVAYQRNQFGKSGEYLKTFLQTDDITPWDRMITDNLGNDIAGELLPEAETSHGLVVSRDALLETICWIAPLHLANFIPVSPAEGEFLEDCLSGHASIIYTVSGTDTCLFISNLPGLGIPCHGVGPPAYVTLNDIEPAVFSIKKGRDEVAIGGIFWWVPFEKWEGLDTRLPQSSVPHWIWIRFLNNGQRPLEVEGRCRGEIIFQDIFPVASGFSWRPAGPIPGDCGRLSLLFKSNGQLPAGLDAVLLTNLGGLDPNRIEGISGK